MWAKEIYTERNRRRSNDQGIESYERERGKKPCNEKTYRKMREEEEEEGIKKLFGVVTGRRKLAYFPISSKRFRTSTYSPPEQVKSGDLFFSLLHH